MEEQSQGHAHAGSLREYYDVLGNTLTKNNLMDKPNLTWLSDKFQGL